MSPKFWFTFAIISLLFIQTFSFVIQERFKRSEDEDEDKEEKADKGSEDGDEDEDKDSEELKLPGIQLGSQQNSQSSQEQSSGKKGSALQQHSLGQQQLAALIDGKHYVLQQQTSLAQQLAKLGRKSAVQQLADAQKQVIANGEQTKSAKTEVKDDVRDDVDDGDNTPGHQTHDNNGAEQAVPEQVMPEQAVPEQAEQAESVPEQNAPEYSAPEDSADD